MCVGVTVCTCACACVCHCVLNPLTSYSISQHQPTVAAMATRWAEFYREYQSLQQWIRNLDMDMSNLNPFVSDLSAVKIQLEKMKVGRQEQLCVDVT